LILHPTTIYYIPISDYRPWEEAWGEFHHLSASLEDAHHHCHLPWSLESLERWKGGGRIPFLNPSLSESISFIQEGNFSGSVEGGRSLPKKFWEGGGAITSIRYYILTIQAVPFYLKPSTITGGRYSARPQSRPFLVQWA